MRVNINNIVSNYELANVLAYKISDSNVSKKNTVEIVESNIECMFKGVSIIDELIPIVEEVNKCVKKQANNYPAIATRLEALDKENAERIKEEFE